MGAVLASRALSTTTGDVRGDSIRLLSLLISSSLFSQLLFYIGAVTILCHRWPKRRNDRQISPTTSKQLGLPSEIVNISKKVE